LVVIVIASRTMRLTMISCKKEKRKRLLWRVLVAATGRAIDRTNNIFSVARSHRFLYWGARRSTEIMIGRCELFQKAVGEAPLNILVGL